MHPDYTPCFPGVRNIAADLIAPLQCGPDNVAHRFIVLRRNRGSDAEDPETSEFVTLFNSQH